MCDEATGNGNVEKRKRRRALSLPFRSERAEK